VSVPEEREDDVASCIQIVHGHEQFSKARLPKIVGQQFDVATSQVAGLWRGNRRRPSNEIPQLGDRTTEEA